MKASDLFIRCLEAEGVDTIFGVPGEENADIMISLLDSTMEFITCRHEQAAAFMADVYGRVTGRPGVCLGTLGPGATNLITGVASATLDYSPLVAIVGQASTKRLHKESHQNMDSIRMFEPVTKWAGTVRDPASIPEVIRKAFKVAWKEKPGATVIELPEDIAKEIVDGRPIPYVIDRQHGGVELHHVQKILSLIRDSRQPVILFGNGAVRARKSGLISEFIDKTGIYAANSFMGKGALSARHSRNLYCVGLGVRDLVMEAFEKSDLVICIGYDLVEWPPDRWNKGAPKKIIHIDTQPAEVDEDYVVDVDMVGEIGETLRVIIENIEECHRKTEPYYDSLRKRMTDELLEFKDDTEMPMKPQKILYDLRLAMGNKDILISDVGAHKMWVARHYPTYQPGTCIITNGFCSMGFALPGAIAAQKVFPDKKVVALCGDGGFMMNVQGLITAVKYRIPVTVIIWNDNGYGLISWKQQLRYCRTSHTELLNPDFVKLAGAYGCRGISIEKASEFPDALDIAFNDRELPTIIIINVDYSQNIKLNEKLGEVICPM